MGNIAVIYKSKYGTTKQYAEWISEELGADLLNTSSVKPSELMSYDIVIYGGGLYAGGIDGISLVVKNPCKQLVIFTVGLSDPNTTDYSPIINKKNSKDLLSKIKIFHLRGGMDYKKLGLAHKGVMSMLKNVALKKEEAQRSEEDKLFLKTYGSKVDFMKKETIAPIIEHIKKMSK